MHPEPFAIFFPPRIIMPDFSKGNHNAVMDDAVERYKQEGLVLVDEQGLKDAQKIIALANSCPELMRPS